MNLELEIFTFDIFSYHYVSRNKKIHCAALDVTEPEPLPRDHPLLALDNIIIAPHWGTATETAVKGMTKAAIDNILKGMVFNKCSSSLSAQFSYQIIIFVRMKDLKTNFIYVPGI